MAELTVAEAIRDALAEEMRRDPEVFVMGEDVGQFGGVFKTLRGLFEEFGPDRVRDTPISEAAIVGAGVGAAMLGARPVVEIMFIDFATVCMDMIVNQAAKIRWKSAGQFAVPLVIRTQGGVGKSASCSQSQSLEAWFAHVPGLKVVVPSAPADFKGLLKTAVRDADPVIFIEHKALYFTRGPVPDGEHLVPFGQARVVREGRDVTVVAFSRQVLTALEAAEAAAKDGLWVEVIDPRTLVPLDKAAILASVRKTHRAVVVHEAVRRGGFGAEIAAVIAEKAFDDLDAPVKRVAGANAPIANTPPLERASIPSPDTILAAIHAVCSRSALARG